MSKRLNLSPYEISELGKKAQKKRVENKTHNWLKQNNGSENARIRVKKQIELGKHISQNPESIIKMRNSLINLAKEGKHPSQKEEVKNKKRISNKISTLKCIEDGRHNSQIKWKCEFCSKEGLGIGNYYRWHGNKCKMNV